MRSSRRLRFASLLATAAIAACALAPRVAHAGEEESKSLFAEGRKLREAGKCDEAIVQFRRALETWPEGLGSLRNVAECEEQLHLYAAARRDWWDLRRAALQSNEPKYQGWDKDAERAYVALEKKVPRLTIQLDAPDPTHVAVRFDGKPVDPRLLGVAIERDVGTFAVDASRDGAPPVSEKVTLAEGERKTITLHVPLPDPTHGPVAGGATAPTATVPPPLPPQGSSGLRTAGFVALGVGAASAIGTVVAVAIRGSALSSIQSGCPNYETQPCPTSLQGDASTGKTASTLANVLGGVAIAGLGAGVALVILSRPHSSSEHATTAELGVAPTANGAFGHVGLRF